MNIEMILPEYRSELTGAQARLAEMVREGKLTAAMFERAEQRLYGTYMAASVRRVAERNGWTA